MGIVKLNYGESQHIWAEGDHLNEIGSDAVLSMTCADESVIVLREFDSEQEARDAHALLSEKIRYGLGNGEVIITIEEL